MISTVVMQLLNLQILLTERDENKILVAEKASFDNILCMCTMISTFKNGRAV